MSHMFWFWTLLFIACRRQRLATRLILLSCVLVHRLSSFLQNNQSISKRLLSCMRFIFIQFYFGHIQIYLPLSAVKWSLSSFLHCLRSLLYSLLWAFVYLKVAIERAALACVEVDFIRNWDQIILGPFTINWWIENGFVQHRFFIKESSTKICFQSLVLICVTFQLIWGLDRA